MPWTYPCARVPPGRLNGRAGRTTLRRTKSRPSISEKDFLWNDPMYWSEPAEQAFARAYNNAHREALIDRLLGRPPGLVSFEKVTEGSGLLPGSRESLQTVLLSRIVGSLGKQHLFSRSFLPMDPGLLPRWKKIFALANGFRGFEPVELYEVDGLFYVVDGHFRVSVARAMDQKTIEARVRPWV